MIDEDKVEGANQYLRDSAKQYGQARGRQRYCESNLRRVKSLQMIGRPGSLGEREAQAYASPEYLQAMQDEENATAEVETIYALRDAARLLIETWRTQTSAKKHGI